MIISTSLDLILFYFSHLRFCSYFSLPIGALFLGKQNYSLPYSRGCNPMYLSVAFKILQSWRFHENQWFNRRKKRKQIMILMRKAASRVPYLSLLFVYYCSVRPCVCLGCSLQSQQMMDIGTEDGKADS